MLLVQIPKMPEKKSKETDSVDSWIIKMCENNKIRVLLLNIFYWWKIKSSFSKLWCLVAQHAKYCCIYLIAIKKNIKK
jgi:hypothetical protein